MAFVKGVSGNPSGRPRIGGGDKAATAEIRDLCRRLFDIHYWAQVKRRLMRGELNPRLEITLLAYAYGPSDKDQTTAGVTVNVGFLTAPPPPQPLEPTPVTLTLVPAESDTTPALNIGLTQEPVLVPAQPVVPPADAG